MWRNVEIYSIRVDVVEGCFDDIHLSFTVFHGRLLLKIIYTVMGKSQKTATGSTLGFQTNCSIIWGNSGAS